jgi:CheY-like chemotaxis protein
LSLALKKLGFLADAVENGELAVQAVAKDLTRYEAIFMDYTMPIMVRSGYFRLILWSK